MKLLSSKLHGIIDYTVVIFLWLAPNLFGLTSPVSLLTYGLGSVHLFLTVLTDFRFGVFKVIPFKVHGWIELIVSVILIASPLVLGGFDNFIDQYFLALFGVAVLITWTTTDYSK